MVAAASTGAKVDDGTVERKSPMSSWAIILMNVGFFGIQFSFGLQQTAVNPLFTLIGASPDKLPILNLAGPITGLFIQPLIGSLSDRTWTRWGRRKPFFIIGAIGCSVCLALFPFVSALWMAVLLLWLLDASNNTAMEPYRAFISDRLPKSQLARGFLTQSLFVGAGAVLANFSLYFFQQLIKGGTASGVPYWVLWAFWLGAICSIGSVLISVLSTSELTPTNEELAAMRAKKGGIGHAVGEIADAIRKMPVGMHKIGLVFFFQWYAMFIYWQFVTVSIGRTVFGVGPKDPAYEQAVGWTGLVNGSYNLVTAIAALFLISLATRFGAKRVHAGALLIAGVALVGLAHVRSKYGVFIPMIGLGIAWASMVGVPYIMAVSMVPKERTGVYMGILNMMIVIPMLIETVTFGWIFHHVLGDRGPNAIIAAGVMLALGSIAMLWVEDPASVDESHIMPLAARRGIAVYNRVVVGSDGSPASLHAVANAADVASAADAHLVVVSAYSPHPNGEPAGGRRRELRGEEDAREALRASVAVLTAERTRQIDQRIVAAPPARALLDTVGTDDESTLIVIGNSGLGASEGQFLGSVPSDVVKHAPCDVLIVQTRPDAKVTRSPLSRSDGRG